MEQLSERCNLFLHKSPTGTSTPHLRSELNLLIEKMDHVYGVSSIYLDKLVFVALCCSQTRPTERKIYRCRIKFSKNVETSLRAELLAAMGMLGFLQFSNYCIKAVFVKCQVSSCF